MQSGQIVGLLALGRKTKASIWLLASVWTKNSLDDLDMSDLAMHERARSESDIFRSFYLRKRQLLKILCLF